MVSVVNLTGHSVVLGGLSGGLAIPAMGPPARVSESAVPIATVAIDCDEIPLVSVTQGAITDLPAPREGVLFIVSRAVALAAPNRDDLVVPYGQNRDLTGQVVSCEALARIEETR